MDVLKYKEPIIRYSKIYSTILKLALYKFFSFLLGRSLRNKNIWIIQERGVDAQDNAWHLFKYIKENHPDVNIYYAIRFNSPEYDGNLKKYHSNVIEYGSFKYYLYLYNAKVYASTHYHSYMPSFNIHRIVQNSFIDISAKKIFLQHGIIHNAIKGLYYPSFNIDLFITGAKNEYELVSRLFNHPNGVVRFTGLARFDNLHDYNTKNQILVMPTWRNRYAGYNDEKFIKTDFFIEYKKILTDKVLNAKLQESGIKLVFYNHFEFQKFNHLFEPFCRGNVVMKKFGEQTVQDMLKESNALVTDFSSIYYDFIYMCKPVIFFLLNQNEFRKGQYGEDYDDVSDFGYACNYATEVIENMIKLIDTGFKLEDKFQSKMETIYPKRDRKNCERIFNCINKLA